MSSAECGTSVTSPFADAFDSHAKLLSTFRGLALSFLGNGYDVSTCIRTYICIHGRYFRFDGGGRRNVERSETRGYKEITLEALCPFVERVV